MANEDTQAGERFLSIMDRLRKVGLGRNASGTVLVSPAQMGLLDWIAASNGCGVQDIADGLNLTPPTVSVGVRRLEEGGLVKRKPNPLDKRSIQFYLTPNGKTLHQQAKDFRRQKLELILSGLTQLEQESLLALLGKALDTVEARETENKK